MNEKKQEIIERLMYLRYKCFIPDTGEYNELTEPLKELSKEPVENKDGDTLDETISMLYKTGRQLYKSSLSKSEDLFHDMKDLSSGDLVIETTCFQDSVEHNKTAIGWLRENTDSKWLIERLDTKEDYVWSNADFVKIPNIKQTVKET